MLKLYSVPNCFFTLFGLTIAISFSYTLCDSVAKTIFVTMEDTVYENLCFFYAELKRISGIRILGLLSRGIAMSSFRRAPPLSFEDALELCIEEIHTSSHRMCLPWSRNCLGYRIPKTCMPDCYQEILGDCELIIA